MRALVPLGETRGVMKSFDPSVIQVFAEELYKRARTIVIFYGVVAGLVGGVLGVFVGQAAGVGAVVGGPALLVLAALVGATAGQEKAFALKLQAQTALCQVAIERNTRPAS